MIEIVVSLALLGVGIAACVACIGSATRASARAEEYTAVELLAREKLSELAEKAPAEGQDGGDFGPDRPGFRWTTRTSSSNGAKRVELSIQWGAPDQPRSALFETFARPGAAGAPAGNVACDPCHPKGVPHSRGGQR